MAIKAHINSSYRKKLAITALFLTAFGLWAAYDVFVKYPPEYERWQSYKQFRSDDNLEAWPAHAKQAGWPEAEPVVREKGHFYYNYVFMLLLPVGLWYGVNVLTAGKRWIKADEDGVSTHKGQSVTYENISEMNEKRWEDKGIAVLMYQDETGQKRRLVLDEFNYQTQPIREMHAKIKAILAARSGEALTQEVEADAPAESTGDEPKV